MSLSSSKKAVEQFRGGGRVDIRDADREVRGGFSKVDGEGGGSGVMVRTSEERIVPRHEEAMPPKDSMAGRSDGHSGYAASRA